MDNRTEKRQQNLARVLQLLRRQEGLSRIDLAEHLGLNRATLTHLCGILLREGIIEERQMGESSARGGRKPVTLGLRESYGYVIGIDVRERGFRAAAVSLQGDLLASWGGSRDGGKTIPEQVALAARHCPRQHRAARCLGVGLSLPGIVNHREGVLVNSRRLKACSLPVAEEAGRLLKLPVLADNDANCCAWGILEQYKNEPLRDFICLVLEESAAGGMQHPELGIGIAVGGEVYHGAHDSAGELPRGYLAPVRPSVRPPSLPGFFRLMMGRLEPILAVLDPERVFLGGDFRRYREETLALVQKYPDVASDREVLFAPSGEDELAVGAASMFLEKLFAAPSPHADDRTAGLQWHNIFTRNRTPSAKDNR